jgi:hypothetical protein
VTRPRVALIVTGRLEFQALPVALARLFPEAEFFIERSLTLEELKDSTSATVDPDRNARDAAMGSVPAIDELVDRLAASVSGRDAADFAVLVEDLELNNRGNEGAVLRAVRDAVGRHLARMETRRHAPRDLAERLGGRASFHLFDPMIEAYFYGDPQALQRAQAGRGGRPRLVIDRDVERFRVDATDAGYFAPVGECPRHRRPRDRRCPWGGAPREEHPKWYLKYLCREAPPHEFCSSYHETDGGVAALRDIDWLALLAQPDGAPFLRAMVEDLSDALGPSSALPDGEIAWNSRAPTARSLAPRDRVLRNV